jgi:hypothetical protein
MGIMTVDEAFALAQRVWVEPAQKLAAAWNERSGIRNRN